MSGRIHSVESFGTVDGPGVRFVIFCQGCPMRCAYCHNPDTWEVNAGKNVGAQELIDRYERNRAFYQGGGITVTGGEPLMQMDFLLELFTLAREKEIHTCIDTSGITYNPDNPEYQRKLEELLALTNLVMLDIKHIDPVKHRELTGQSNDRILAFAEYLSDRGVELWIRHVVVPTVTDDDESLYRLGCFIGGLKTVKALDVLAYHTMGEVKYEKMGLEYKLKGIPAMDQKTAVQKKEIILDGIRARRGMRTPPHKMP